jgi:hypothetical protein
MPIAVAIATLWRLGCNGYTFCANGWTTSSSLLEVRPEAAQCGVKEKIERLALGRVEAAEHLLFEYAYLLVACLDDLCAFRREVGAEDASMSRIGSTSDEILAFEVGEYLVSPLGTGRRPRK